MRQSLLRDHASGLSGARWLRTNRRGTGAVARSLSSGGLHTWEREGLIHAAIHLEHGDDSEPVGLESALGMAIRVLALARRGHLADARYYNWCQKHHLLWIGNDPRAYANAGGWNGWDDAFGAEHSGHRLQCRCWR